ncbi:MAG: DUF2085 domain-containing protein [Acidobacteriota bacterium]|nr:DUF2085 domain-containing protein [Acidobacteriota bacterium]MDH3785749.1 DUF2085 domain-containing protein [Acidobacteriota bacterium]
MARRTLAVVTTTLLMILFAGGTVLVPWLESRGEASSSIVRLMYAPVCHQKAERSLEIFGHRQAVCSRCSGLYAGAIIGMLLAWAFLVRDRDPRPIWFAIGVLPTFIDAILPWVGLPQLSEVPRWFLALPAGAVAGLFLNLGAAELFPERVTKSMSQFVMENGNG